METFGCQMNESDSELVRSLLKQNGFTFTEDRERADVVLMNTCAIRENAHHKVYSHLADLKGIKTHRPLVVGVLGCMAQSLKTDLTEKEPLVDVLAGPDSYRQLPALLSAALRAKDQGFSRKEFALDLSEYETYAGVLPDRSEGVNAWITVMRGCDNFCTFCVVPYTRGRERSRAPEDILAEARAAAAQGFKQVTLLGQNVNSYQAGDWDFSRLIIAVADVPGIERVRFTSPHPKDFPNPLLQAIAEHPHICKHIHLPLQAGGDRVLNLMGRTYTAAEYMRLVDQIRRIIPHVVLSTDIICGFCSETDREFLETERMMREVRYHSAFIFKYSERKNTIASRKFPDDVPDSTKSDRVTRLVDLQRRISLERNREVIGQTVRVLVEGNAKRSSHQGMGRTDGNLPVVWNKDDAPLVPGSFLDRRVRDASATTLYS
jgi:tRNA-2-methylthio-N6-dimethylallyladenosine synthase